MRNPIVNAALLGATLLCSAIATTSAHAQRADSTRRWALFGGSAPMESPGLTKVSNNVELGASGDFRLGFFPLPLRASVAVSQAEQRWSSSQLRFGSLSLDAVAHPLPRIFGSSLYLLGGIGGTSRAAYRGSVSQLVPPDFETRRQVDFSAPRQSWGFVETGAGLEVGRAFVQWKVQWPVFLDGQTRAPISVGFRF